MTAELTPGFAPQGVRLAASLSGEPLPCPFLLAGAPSELADCPIRAPHRVTFARLPEESGAELVRQLGEVLGLCNESQLQEDLPNLKGFVANPDLTIFSRE